MLMPVPDLPQLGNFQGDEERIRPFRMQHLPAYREALPWLRREAEIVDTTGAAPHDVARRIASAASASFAQAVPGPRD